MSLWRSLEGQVEVELLTADSPGALKAISQAGILLTGVSPEKELTVSFQIQRPQIKKLREIVKKRGERAKICRELGIYYILREKFCRRLLIMGCLLLLAAAAFIPTRVFFFEVSGNSQIPDGQILAEAANLGLYFGVSRRAVRSEQIKNGLLHAIPELKWAGINTYGCVAKISVAENEAEQATEPINSGVGHIVSRQDGIIRDVTVTCGTALCSPGQAVSKGQILISGFMDCGIVQKSSIAQGEVTAITRRTVSVQIPEKHNVRGVPERRYTRWSVCLGKKRIKLWFGSGICDTRCGRMYKTYPLVLPGGFCLPVALVREEQTWSASAEESIERSEALPQVASLAEMYLKSRMLSGSIRQKQENLVRSDGCWRLTGNYLCQEIISQRQWEQIGDRNE